MNILALQVVDRISDSSIKKIITNSERFVSKIFLDSSIDEKSKLETINSLISFSKGNVRLVGYNLLSCDNSSSFKILSRGKELYLCKSTVIASTNERITVDYENTIQLDLIDIKLRIVCGKVVGIDMPYWSGEELTTIISLFESIGIQLEGSLPNIKFSNCEMYGMQLPGKNSYIMVPVSYIT